MVTFQSLWCHFGYIKARFQKTLILVIVIILVSGIIDLFIDKIIEKGGDFDIMNFIFGKRYCGIYSVLKKIKK